jgi:hypothetical protein
MKVTKEAKGAFLVNDGDLASDNVLFGIGSGPIE